MLSGHVVELAEYHILTHLTEVSQMHPVSDDDNTSSRQQNQ
jgi:hypothetical protein